MKIKMAILKFAGKKDTPTPKIYTQAHLSNVYDYATKKEKTDMQLISYYNCINHDRSVLTEFLNDRIFFNQNEGILVSHLVQSFSPSDNITPELAHKIGQELLDRCASDYKAVLITHVDRKHIHNHLIVNSCSLMDGKKFYDNMDHLKMLRKVSDELCRKYNLSVIENDNATKYYPLDQATLNAAKQGRSWKFDLVKDLDIALETCQSKDEFVEFLQSHDYEIKFTNQNITFRKNGNKKGIRADTLAKQFGQKYSKAGIEKKLNISSSAVKKPSITSKVFTVPNYDYYNQLAAVNWKRYQKKYADRIRINDKSLSSARLFTKNPFLFSLRLIRYIVTQKNKKRYVPKRKVKTFSTAFHSWSYIDYKTGKKIIGNIPYREIVNSFGETAQIKLYAWQITHLLNNNVLLSARVDLKTGTAVVTIKKTDLQKVSAVLGVPYESFAQQADLISNRKITAELKRHNVRLSYLLVTPEQAAVLKEHCILFAAYKKGEKINIAFAPEDKEKVLSALYPNREEKKVNAETFFQRNSALNQRLKDISKETGERLCYKVISAEQFSLLKEKITMESIAAFRKTDGRFNLVFLESQKPVIEKALGTFIPKADTGTLKLKL